MRTTKPCVLLGGLALLLGCESTATHLSRTDRDGLLAFVPEESQQEIERARERRAELDEQLAIAKRDQAEAGSLEGLATQNRAAMEVRLREGVGRLGHARDFDDDEALADARRQRAELEAAVRLQTAKQSYYDDVEALARRRLDLLNERAKLEDARVELAKAEAVAALDRPAAAKVDLDAQRADTNRAADRVERARIEALVARRRAELRAEYVEACAANVPEELRLQPIESIDAVFAGAAPEAAGDTGDAAEAAAEKTANAKGEGDQ
ncbi:MAG: hypothetical protein KDE27_29235 [Planctomycetes bacterium]|nr:hypothetical protein [Planctomycetota bacterium]